MILLLIIILLLVISIFFLLSNHKKHASFNPPPGPKPLPLIGNLHQFDPLSPHLYFTKLTKIYGPIISLRLPKPTVVIQSAKIAKEVLTTQDHNFCSRPQMFGPRKLAYDGLDIAFSPYNEYFREMKKLCVVHLLGSRRVQSFSPIRCEEVSKLIEKITILSSASEIVNLNELLASFAFSNISRIAFGKRYEDDKVSKFQSLLNETQALFAAFFFADHIPYMGWLDKLTGQSSRLERVFKEMDEFYGNIIKEHLDPNKRESNEEMDILDVLLQLKKEGGLAFDITLDHIKAILMDIFIGGTGTTIVTIVWAMTELVRHPNVMRKVQQEIRSVVKNQRFVTDDDIQKLEYLKAILKETFRLHPPIPLLLMREAINKTAIEGYDVLPKTLLYVNAWAIGRDPQIWDEPERFMPERFLLGSSIDFKGQNFELIPFGAGRRICPGLHLGTANIELTLANLLCSFDWDLPPGVSKEDVDVHVLPGSLIHKKNPLCLVARKFS